MTAKLIQLVIFVLFLSLYGVQSEGGFYHTLTGHDGFGPWVVGTKGKIWPKPQMEKVYETFFTIDPSNFQFKLVGQSESCEIIRSAAERIQKRMFPLRFTLTHPMTHPMMNNVNYGGSLNVVEVNLNSSSGCKNPYPEMNMDEHYEIKIDTPDSPGQAKIISFSCWGIIRGLESFSHLVHMDTNVGMFMINGVFVNDFPRFSYRGLMLDSSRHFLPKDIILQTLDLMEMSKYNVFHWHLSDDPSFPYVSSAFPELSNKGAFTQSFIYSQEDVKEIIEEARIRGIRVIPEFDTPGHTQSWGQGQPGFLTDCPSAPAHGPALNPIKDSVYSFLTTFFNEIMKVFPDSWIHLGGDEVDKTCWEHNPDIVAFMKKNNWTDYNKLEAMYIQKLTKIVSAKTPMVWEEIINDGAVLDKRTILHVWKGGWQNETEKITSMGYNVILSSPFYLNYISYGIDWPKYYAVNPTDFGGDDHQKKRILGAETCVWGEYINRFNLHTITWPRASVVAERMWSSEVAVDKDDAARRLEEHACRMVARGFPVQPANGPGFCP